MSYARFDDGVLDHPKMEHAEELFPDFAWVLWSRALVYVNKHKLDGKVPRRALAKFIKSKRIKPLDVARALVTAGLWDEDGEDFCFHDFRSWNLTREEREAAARKNREKQAAFRDKQRAIAGERQGTDAAASAPVTGHVTDDVTGYAPPSNSVSEMTVTDDALAPTQAPASAPSSPLLSPPLPLPSGSGESEAPESDDPTEAELFGAYTRGTNTALGCMTKHVRDDRASHALTTLWGAKGYGKMPKAAFLEMLEEKAEAYVRAAVERGQPAQFEAQYAPHRFLAWVNAAESGTDPWPRAQKPKDAPVSPYQRREGLDKATGTPRALPPPPARAGRPPEAAAGLLAGIGNGGTR